MLPSRQPDRVVALDDADIVECHELSSPEIELDLGDAVEIQPAAASRLPAPRTPPLGLAERRPSGTLQIPGFLQPQTRLYQFEAADPFAGEAFGAAQPLTLKTPTRELRPAVIASQLPETVARPPHSATSAQLRAASAMRDEDDEDEELTELKPPSRASWNPQPSHSTVRSPSHITPSPFARSFVMQDPTQERPESIAPVAVSNYPSAHVPAHGTGQAAQVGPATMRLRAPFGQKRGQADDEVARAESALEQRELTAITSTPSTKILRGVALMLMGGVAAAAITAYALRNEVPTASMSVAPPPPMASITVPQDAVVIGTTPPPQVETRPGAQPVVLPAAGVAEPPAAQAPATVVKFGDGDALLVTPPATPATPASPALLDSAGASAHASPSANANGTHRPRKSPQPPQRSQPLAPNALLPDSDSPPSYSLPPSRGGAPKDPVAEAQLRASMR